MDYRELAPGAVVRNHVTVSCPRCSKTGIASVLHSNASIIHYETESSIGVYATHSVLGQCWLRVEQALPFYSNDYLTESIKVISEQISATRAMASRGGSVLRDPRLVWRAALVSEADRRSLASREEMRNWMLDPIRKRLDKARMVVVLLQRDLDEATKLAE